ncbi:MAG TPA: cyclic nucleotide-binding domain-containing protein [Xanthobacteraceae bacterium]|nr:cyclic nucleotide-binding domain-containing protein [Xanthobacteraceae bacterium]
MTIEDDIAFLERVPILKRLGAGALRILAIGAESYSVQAGQALFAAGDAADCAYVVQHGSFALQPERASDAELVAGPGSLLGEMALLAETRRPATATAREDATVMRIPRAMFLKMLESYPDAAQRLRELLTARADQWARELDKVRATLARGTEPQT